MVLLLGVPYTTLTELIGTQPTHLSLESSSQEDEKDYGDEGIRQCVLFARLVLLMEIDLGR